MPTVAAVVLMVVVVGVRVRAMSAQRRRGLASLDIEREFSMLAIGFCRKM